MAGISLTPRQLEAADLLVSARHVLLYGGARSGKTFIAVMKLLQRAYRNPGSRLAVFRFRFNHLRASVWLDTLPKVARLTGVRVEDRRQDGYALVHSQKGTSEIWFGGLDDRERTEKILGQEFSLLYFNEVSQIPYSSVTMALTRLAQRCGAPLRAWYDCNPPSTGHWSHKLFIEHRDPVSKASLPNPDDYRALAMNPRDNLPNLPADYLRGLEALPERQRRRFLEGRFTDETEGALWTLDTLERCRAAEDDVPEFDRVVIAVDPSGTSGPDDERSDEVGIVAVGRGRDGIAYVLGDYTLRASPEGWARTVLAAYDKHEADAIVAERNFGGDMVPAMFRNLRRNLPVHVVTASRGKHIRAEPVAALYDRDKVRHAGRFEQLEDQLLGFTQSGFVGDKSPDRADALIHGLTELMLGHQQHGTAGPVGVEATGACGVGHGGGHGLGSGGVAVIV